MKQNGPSDINQMATAVAKARTQLAGLPFLESTKKVKDAHQARKIRLEIARLLTKIHELSYQNAKNP